MKGFCRFWPLQYQNPIATPLDDPGFDSDDDDNEFNVDNIVSGVDDDDDKTLVLNMITMITFVLMMTLVLTMMIETCVGYDDDKHWYFE